MVPFVGLGYLADFVLGFFGSLGSACLVDGLGVGLPSLPTGLVDGVSVLGVVLFALGFFGLGSGFAVSDSWGFLWRWVGHDGDGVLESHMRKNDTKSVATSTNFSLGV